MSGMSLQPHSSRGWMLAGNSTSTTRNASTRASSTCAAATARLRSLRCTSAASLHPSADVWIKSGTWWIPCSSFQCYSSLTLRGLIESLATRFNHLVSAFKKKPYNPLDHRKMEFAVDFGEFQHQVIELEEQLCGFMATSFSQVNSCMQSLQLVKR